MVSRRHSLCVIPAGEPGSPPLQGLLGTAALPARYVVLLLPYPFIGLGADELRKWIVPITG
jgi:hypothetical protein